MCLAAALPVSGCWPGDASSWRGIAPDRLNAHTSAVACQTCHIPRMAVGAPTKMAWDWSTAGRDLDIEDPHVYQKKKGSFVYMQNVPPEYFRYNGDPAYWGSPRGSGEALP